MYEGCLFGFEKTGVSLNLVQTKRTEMTYTMTGRAREGNSDSGLSKI